MSAIQGRAATTGRPSGAGRPRGRTGWIGRVAFAVLAAGSVFAAAGCTSGLSSTAALGTVDAAPAEARAGAAEAAPSAAPAAPLVDGEFAAAPEAADSTGSGAAGQQLAPVVDGSKVIKTGDLSIRLVVAPVPETDDTDADREADAAARAAAVAEAAGAARGIATGVGGFQSSADGGGSTMTISLRVPADQYDATLERLAALGEITSRTETSQDVTAELVDVNSRVDSMTASVARVRALLAQATSIAEVIAIESELAVREANLESLQQQQAYLDGQVALSTVTVTFTAVTDNPATAPPADQQTGFVAGLAAGWAALLDFFGWIGGALGAILPFLPLVAVVVLAVWWPVRRARRRRAAARGTAPAPVAPPAAAGSPEPAPQPTGVGVG